ncbi:MAG: class 1 fructose-bisphosphatase, partial [Methylococcaceae bacterium]|nr:class 1 fructose-bisphosphatase [Methylococcaceae bacterium]
MANKVTLTQFIIEQQRGLPDASGTFSMLLNNIVTACKEISHLV